MKKRILSLALALVMLFSLTSPAAWAAPGDEQPTNPSTNSTVNGRYENGNWTQKGDGSVQHTIGDSTVTLSKTATPVAGKLNTYDVTLSLVTSTTVVPVTDAAATVLVIDLSNSMNNSVSGSTSRLAAAKAAAKQFLEGSDGQVGYAGTDASADRWLAIVGYGTTSKTFMGWANVAGGPGKNSYDQALATIDSMAPGFSNSANTSYTAYSDSGGTNLESGIRLAENLLDTSDVANFANKFSVVLTDGVPTFRLSDSAGETSTTALGVKVESIMGYRYNTSDEAGNGQDGSNANNTAARNAAADLKATPAKLYTVCFGVATQNTYTGGPTVGNFLRDSIASPAEAASGDTPAKTYAFNADNTAQLMAAFGAITDSITNGLDGNGWTATDPMPGYISVSGVSAGNVTSANGEDYTWTLSDPETSTSGGTTTYTYTATYRIVIDHTQVEEGVYYPANEPTYLTVDGQQYAFPVPGVNAVYPEYEVSYEYEGDVPAGAPALPATETYKYKDSVTVAATPSVEGYTFSDWSRTGTFEMPNNDVVISGTWAKRSDLSYTVNYYWNGTTDKVSASKVMTGQTFMDEVTESPIDVAGCTPVSDASKTITIAVSGNEINFYYYKNVEIVANSDTDEVYDGAEHSVSGFTGAPADADFSAITVGAKGTKADTYPAKFAAGVVGTVDGTAKYIITKATDGQLVIAPLGGVVVTITENSGVVDYNGDKQSVTGYKVTSIKLNGEDTTLYTEADFAFVGVAADKTAEGTNVGKYDMGLSAALFENKNADFADVTFVIVDGQLKIKPVALTITADSNTKTYDGTALTDNGWKDTAPVGLKGADAVISVVVAGSQTVVGTAANVASGAMIKDDNGNDVTGNYNITYVNGTLEVTKKAVTVTADNDTKVYDGTPLTKNSYTDTGLAAGDKFDAVTVTGSQTVVGTANNVPSAAKIVNAKGEDVTASYDITYVNGTLEVTPKTLTVTAGSDEKVYDGTALTKNSAAADGLAEGDKMDAVTVTGSQTVVGTANNVPSDAKIVNAAGEDVTASYTINYNNGTLEVTPKALTITADNAAKAYDGTPLTKNSYTDTGLAAGDKFDSVTITGSQTEKGKSDNVASDAKIVNAKGEDVTTSYAITYAKGELEVSTKAVTITAMGHVKIYDGTALTLNEYTNTALAEGDRIESVTITGSQTNVGKTDNVPSDAKIVNKDGKDVTASYAITYANGTLEVTKRVVVLTSATDTKEYDGTPLTNDEVTVSVNGWANGEGASYSVTGTQTLVGSSDNTFTYTLNEGTDAANYDITTEFGKLTVTDREVKYEVTVEANSNSATYDGDEHTAEGFKTLTFEVEGQTYTVEGLTASVTKVDAGTYSNEITGTAVVKDAAGNDVTAQFAVNEVDGKLVIDQKALTIYADSDTKEYDGVALTKDSYTNTALAEGDEFESVTVTGSQTVKGSSENVASAAKIVNADGKDVTANYDIKYVDGLLTVTANDAAVVIEADSNEKMYDGSALTDNGYTYNEALLPENHTIEAVVEGTITNVGTVDNVVTSYVVKNADGKNVTDSFSSITTKDGELKITKRSVTLTSADDEKVYDGKVLANNNVTVSGDGWANGEGASYDNFASITQVGTTNNTFEYTLNEGTLAGNYDITVVPGTLEITKKALTITANSDEKVYDGSALTLNSYTYDELAEGDSFASVTVTGSQTVVGTSNNVPSEAKIVNTAGEDVTSSYDITYANGTLEVTKKAITVTADSDSKIYDGKALTKNSYTADALAEGDSFDSVTVTGSQTVVGSSDNVPSEAKIVNTAGEDVTSSYDITYANGTLEVTGKKVTITADDANKTYDGKALTKDSFTNTALAAGDRIESVTVTGSQTVVGSSANVPSAAKIVNAAGEDVTASYVVKYENGTLTVTKKTLTITADSDSKTYDATALTKDSYTNSALAEGDSITSVTVTGSQTVVGTSDNVPSAAVIKNTAGEDVTSSYDITYANGTLEITKKDITVTADSDSKVYDATALTKDSYTNTELAEGDSFDSVTVTGSQTVVGTSDNVPSAAVIKNAAGEDVTSSYDITYVNGTLEITKKAITVTADSDSKVYDATALTKDSYTNSDLATGDSFDSVTVTGSQTVVGTSDNVPSAAVIKNAAGEDVTSSYDITYVNGTLEITKKAITVTADDANKTYDGKALTKDSYTNTALATGDSFASVTVTGSQTVVGTSDNVPSAAVIKNAAGEDVTSSYDITYVNGTLKVTQKEITVTADSDSKIYDGEALIVNSYTSSDLAEGDEFASVTVTGSQTVVGSSDNVPSAAKIVNAAGEDVTASYKIAYVNGTLKVTGMEVTITAESASQIYNGEALTKDSFTNTALAKGDSIVSVTVTGSQTVVGSSENVPSAAKIVNAAGEDVTASYTITYVNGTLEVTPMALTITADSDSKVYDATALTKDSYTNTALAKGDSIVSVTVTGSQTVVGSSDNVPSAAKIVNAAGEDVTASYDITYVNGTLEITKKALTITADSDTKTYDGEALTKDSFTNTALAAGDSIASVTVTGSQTVVGSSDNVPSAAVIKNAAGEDVTSSYDITYVNGTLEVTKKAITVTADSDSKVYDATALTKDSYTNTALAEGDSFASVTVTGSQTVVGSSDNVPSAAKIVNAAGEDVTASYDISYVNGTLTVTQKGITITADSDTKTYDGEALTKDSFTNSALAAGDSIASVTVTGSQTVVGSSDNVPSAAKIVNAAGEDVTASYTITYVNGTLTVTQKGVTITADSDVKVYDGFALTKDSYTNTALAEGDSIVSVTVTGSQTVVGSSDNVASEAKIVNAAGEDVTASYTITYKTGTLTVTEKALTIIADSANKVYDGSALTKDSYTYDELAEGDSFASVTVTGSQTVVGSSDNVPSAAKIVNAAGEDVTASYTITYVKGELEVTPKTLTITADSDSKVYDATALTKDSYTNSALAAGDSFASVTVTGSQTVVGKSDNVPSAAKIVNAAGEDVTASYTITYVNGKLEVTPKTLTITAVSDSKVYDATALTKDSFTNTDLAEGDSIASVTVTGSQTVVGKSDNVASQAKIVNAAGEDVTASYTITYVKGELEVTPKALTITAVSDSKVYDATALTKDSYTSTDLATGDSFASVTVTGSQTVVGKSDNVASAAVIKNADGEDVTASYTITYVKGELEVTPKTLTITAVSDSKVYDATALTKDSYTSTDLAEGDSIASVTVTGSQTVVGTSDNVASEAKIVNADGEDVTASYTITYVKGELEVTPKALTITADSDSKVYDATALTKDSYTNTDLAEGDSIASVTVTGSQTVVGTSDNVASEAKIVNADGEDVTASYAITYVKGELEITPKALAITADSDSKVYDATALTKDSYTSTDLATGDSFKSVTVTGSQTVVGESDNVASEAKIINADGEDVTASYDITYVNGTLTVTKKAITVTADSGSKVYDATALTKDSYTSTDLATGDSFASVVLTGSQTVVGKSDNVASEAKIVNADGEDVTASYEITYVKGELEVTPKAITVTADSDSKIYDGTPLTKDSYTSTDLAEGDSFASVTVTGSQTVVGENDNVPSDAIINNAAGEDVTSSYTITYVNGKLVVNKHTDAELVAEGYTGVYDGLDHEGVTAKDVIGDVEGDEWIYSYSIDGETYTEEMPQYKDVGNYTVYVKAENPNYEGDKLITTVPVVITPATIVVTADDHTIATGDPDPELTYQFVTPVIIETPAFSGELVRESGSGKGEYPINQGTLALADGEGFKASNYVLEYVPGNLTILLRAMDLVKIVDKDTVRVGDTITYTITVTNVGEVELTNVTVYDPMMPGVEEIIPVLAIGESWTKEYTYLTTADDADRILVNVAIAGDDEEQVVTEVLPPIPDTGDHTPVTLLGVTMLLSAAGIILMLRKQRKEENV